MAFAISPTTTMALAALFLPLTVHAQQADDASRSRPGGEQSGKLEPVQQGKLAADAQSSAPPELPPSLEAETRYDYNTAKVDRQLDQYAKGLPVFSRSRGGPPPMRGTPVRERRHPDYAAIGKTLGSWSLNAEAGASVGYDSNVLRDADLNSRGDIYSRGFAAAQIASDWGRHSLSLSGDFAHRFYSKYSSKDGSEYSIDAKGRLDVVGRSDLSFEASHERQIIEPFRSGGLSGLLSQVRYDQDEVEAGGAYRGGRVEITGSATLGRRRYLDAATADGTVLDQSYRNYDRSQFEISAAYLLSGANAAFVSYTRDRRSYTDSTATISPDVTTHEVIGGLRGEITPLIQGQIGIGVLRSDYDDPALPTTNVFGFNSQITWLPTELTTVTLIAAREQEGSVRQSDGGYIATRFRGQVDHELLRNLLLLGQVEVENDDYRATTRTDHIYRVTLGADWSVNHHLRETLRFGFGRRSSSAFETDNFSEFRVTVGASYAL